MCFVKIGNFFRSNYSMFGPEIWSGKYSAKMFAFPQEFSPTVPLSRVNDGGMCVFDMGGGGREV